MLNLGLASLTAGGSLTISGGGVISLVNDNATPGNKYFYGTDGSGNKGWFQIAASEVSGITGTAGQVLANGNAATVEVGVVTLTLSSALTGILSVDTATASNLVLKYNGTAGITLGASSAVTFAGAVSGITTFSAGGALFTSDAGGNITATRMGAGIAANGSYDLATGSRGVLFGAGLLFSGTSSVTSASAQNLVLNTNSSSLGITLASATGVATFGAGVAATNTTSGTIVIGSSGGLGVGGSIWGTSYGIGTSNTATLAIGTSSSLTNALLIASTNGVGYSIAGTATNAGGLEWHEGSSVNGGTRFNIANSSGASLGAFQFSSPSDTSTVVGIGSRSTTGTAYHSGITAIATLLFNGTGTDRATWAPAAAIYADNNGNSNWGSASANASRLIFQVGDGAGALTTALTIAADKSATFAAGLTMSGTLTGAATLTGTNAINSAASTALTLGTASFGTSVSFASATGIPTFNTASVFNGVIAINQPGGVATAPITINTARGDLNAVSASSSSTTGFAQTTYTIDSAGTPVGVRLGATKSGTIGYVGTTTTHDFQVQTNNVTALTLTYNTLVATFASTATSTSTITGSGVFGGGVGIAGALWIGDSINISTTSGTAFNLNVASGINNPLMQLQVAGTTKALVGVAGANGNIIGSSLAGDMAIRANAQKILFSSDSGTTTALAISGASSTGTVTVGFTTTASSTTTGALQVAGGASVQGAFYVGGLTNIAGALQTGSTTITSTGNSAFTATTALTGNGDLMNIYAASLGTTPNFGGIAFGQGSGTGNSVRINFGYAGANNASNVIQFGFAGSTAFSIANLTNAVTFTGNINITTSGTAIVGLGSVNTLQRDATTGITTILTNTGRIRHSVGNYSQSAWGLTGAMFSGDAATITDSSTAANATVGSTVFHSFAAPVIGTTNTGIIYTTIATLYVAGGPTNGGGNTPTLSNSYGFWNGGNTLLQGYLNIQAGGGVASNALVVAGGSTNTKISVDASFSSSGIMYLVNNTAIKSYYGAFSVQLFQLDSANTTSGYLALFGTGSYISVAGTTASTNSTTGAVILAGAGAGLGVAGNIISGGGIGWGVTSTATATTTTTLTVASTAVQIFTGSTTQSIQLPAANVMGAGTAVLYVIKNRSLGSVTILRAGSDTIDGGVTSYILNTFDSITLVSNGVNEWELV